MQRSIAVLILLALVALPGCTATTPPTTGVQPLPTATTTEPATVAKPHQSTPREAQSSPPAQHPRNLEATTALVVGAGQTGTITVTNASTIRNLVHIVSAQPAQAEPDHQQASLYYIGFRAGEQPIDQLWVLQRGDTHDVVAWRFDGEPTWHPAPSDLNELLKPMLQQVPGMKTP